MLLDSSACPCLGPFFQALYSRYSPRLFNNGQIVSRQRREYREVPEVELGLLGELRLADGEAVEVGAGDGQALAVEVPGDGQRAVDPARKRVKERNERGDQDETDE